MAVEIVRVENLVKVYGKHVRALDGLSLSFEARQVYAVLGPNGAGKTTLIRLLATLLPGFEGHALIAGIDVRERPADVRKKIGLAGQYAAVDEFLTGRENVEMVGQLYGLTWTEARRQARSLIEKMGLHEFADRQVGTYSGGQRRRTDLAASLIGQPELLFLDEPTNGLDPASRLSLWDAIKGLVDQGTTVLLTTQYLEEADRLADRIAVINHGRLISEGTSDELKDYVGGSVVEVSVGDKHVKKAIQVLEAGHPGLLSFDQHRQKIILSAPEGARSLVKILAQIEAAHIELQDVALHKPSLDDVFLALTGNKPS